MTDQLPAPPLPASVNLQPFRRMPLDVARLRDSDMARDPNPEGFRCAVIAWCVAWHQVPAASLPDDDRALADLIGIGRTARAVKEWRELRDVALRGFVKCSDGRLYHRVVSEMAIEAWGAQLEQRWKSECGRLKKHGQRTKTKPELPTFNLWINRECPEAKPYMSRWTRHNVPEDTEQSPEGQPQAKQPESPGKSPPREGKGREGTVEPNQRFPGDSSISPPRPPQEAEAAQPPTSTPEASARIVAECARAKVEDPTEANPIIARWIRNGVTPAQVIAATTDARKSMPFPKTLKAGYVDTILTTIIEADRTARAQAEAKVDRTKAQIAEQHQAASHAAQAPDALMAPYRRKQAAA